ncbi:hypothetical protein PV350_13890 [Streptomyces sp. PA03-6a]|nr:hypothetical protein [Streptomyces sp. PA03-6a]
MEDLTHWRLAAAPGGWVRATKPADRTTIYMRLRGTGDGPQQRLNVHSVVMESVSPISTHIWRDVPFKDVEKVANNVRGVLRDNGWNPFREELLKAPEAEPVSVDQLERYFGSPEALASLDGPSPVVSNNMVILAGEASPGEEPPPLTKPEGRITDDFLRSLSRTYQWLVASGETAPATVLAQQTGAPVATVRRWVVNARQRGFMPPGRPGRAG